MKKPKPTKRPKPHKKPRNKRYSPAPTPNTLSAKEAYSRQILGLINEYPRLGICGEPIY